MTSRFQSTHPARGATPYWCVLARPAFHFNPRTPRGVRRDGMSAPMRGGDFNPRTPRGVRQYAGADLEAIEKISIHAPREGCDYYKSKRPSWSRYFNPRTPRGVRLTGISRGDNIAKFQSTHPARGATVFWYQPHIPQFYFNPRTPRGVRQGGETMNITDVKISIHAPREGCDGCYGSRAHS